MDVDEKPVWRGADHRKSAVHGIVKMSKARFCHSRLSTFPDVKPSPRRRTAAFVKVGQVKNQVGGWGTFFGITSVRTQLLLV